jgi:hypothetical protein
MTTPEQPPPKRTHVSPAEFARLRGLSLSSVGRYLKAGRLPFVQAVPRGRVMIPVDALIECCPKPPQSPGPPSQGPTVGRRRGPRPKWARR